MSNQFAQAFQPIRESSAPAFNTTLGMGASDGSVTYGLEASADNAQGATNIRKWDYPTSRTIRVASIAGDDFYVNLGSSDILAEVGHSMLVLGGNQEILRVQPGQTSVAFISSTDITVNVTLGYGGGRS